MEVLKTLIEGVVIIEPRLFKDGRSCFLSLSILAWDDPELNIDWKIPAENVILSEKDGAHPNLRNSEWLFDYSEILY